MRPKTILTVGEVAALCGVGDATVVKWCNSGTLACYRVPGSQHRRIHRDVLDRFMEAHGMKPPVVDEPKQADPPPSEPVTAAKRSARRSRPSEGRGRRSKTP